ncbi:RidA family protein [Phytoactinopolyspora alkaliphila]|uniref:RidA family protein n=1 Tax=Phytoactinopolyspora alkaliphila TaxID=1783498 RepID=A0A6N9YSV3_9ACTN|nr:RidA family protein [Phytoactinopolyspora alkaliphila]NED97889.1 RidA family protein [Phytoactinopolyspora alkaliphila]
MMSTAEDRLAEALAVAPAPVGAKALIDPVVVADGVAYVSGQVAFVGAEGPLLGKVGAGVTVERAAEEAGKAVANGLYRLIEAVGSLDAVERVLKLTVFVNAVDDLIEQPEVANGASRVLLEVLGDRGRHARSAVGVASLPLGVPVEVELVVKVRS